MSDWIEPGQQAPDFTLAADDGTKIKLSAQKGHPVVLYFYPKDDTPGCTREACAFRDRHADLKQRRAKVFGVSPDGIASHEKFRDKFQLNFPLLADLGPPRGRKVWGLARTEPLWQEVDGNPCSTYLIAADGRVARVWKKVSVDGHDAEVLAALDELD